MLFTNTPRSRRNKAQSRLASACGQAVETLESRRLLSVWGLDITAVTSTADTDGGAGGAEHVTVMPGSTVKVDFSYSSSAVNPTTAKLILGGIGVSTDDTDVPSGTNKTASLSLRIPTGTPAGTYGAHVQVKNDKVQEDPGSPTDNDNDSMAVDVIITVAPLATTLSIGAGDVTYSGSAYSESNITSNLTPSGALGAITYKFFSDAAGSNEITAPTNAGTYYVKGHFASNDLTKWLGTDSAIVSFTIDPLATTLAITADTVTYDGSAYADSNVHATLTPADALGTITYTFFSDAAGANEIAAPTNAGTYYVQAHFAASANWLDADSNIAEFEIAKADATVTVENYAGTYDGSAHTASVTITGVGGRILAAGSVSRTNAGSDSVTASISDSQNYNDASGTATIDIAKADATIIVEGYSGNYDGQAHGASGTATGVLGEGLSGLDLGESFTNFPGGTAHWVFKDVTGNYNDAAGEVEIAIAKATLTGIARTQDALNIAKQGTLSIDISSIAGLVGTDTIAGVFGTAAFKLTIGSNDYEYQPTVSIDALTNTVHVSYVLKGGTAAADALRADLLALDSADGVTSTSASKTPYSTMWVVAESANYTFSDDFLTRLFCSAK